MTFQILKPWLVMALIFLTGGVTGSLLTLGLGSHFIHPPGIRDMKRHWMEHLTRRLNLTPAQQAQIEPILTAAGNEMQSVHHEEIGRIEKIADEVSRQIMPLLTPAQLTELKKMQTEREKIFAGGRMRPLPPSHDGPADGTAPPPVQP